MNSIGWLVGLLVLCHRLTASRVDPPLEDSCFFSQQQLNSCKSEYGSLCNLEQLGECLSNVTGSCNTLCTRNYRDKFIYQIQTEADCTISLGDYDMCLKLLQINCLDKLKRIRNLNNSSSTADVCRMLTFQTSCLADGLQGYLTFFGPPLSDTVCHPYNSTVLGLIDRVAHHRDIYCASNATISEICPNGADFGLNAITSTSTSTASTTVHTERSTRDPPPGVTQGASRSDWSVIGLIITFYLHYG